MKLLRLTFVTLFCLAFIADISCRKSTKGQHMSRAVITGYDPRRCACCGGLMINFEGDTVPGFSADYYLIQNHPDSLGITYGTTFPVFADVKWTLVSSAGCGSKGFVRIEDMMATKRTACSF